jgi:hypothetical protein
VARLGFRHYRAGLVAQCEVVEHPKETPGSSLSEVQDRAGFDGRFRQGLILCFRLRLDEVRFSSIMSQDGDGVINESDWIYGLTEFNFPLTREEVADPCNAGRHCAVMHVELNFVISRAS